MTWDASQKFEARDFAEAGARVSRYP
jgi:hypothetical protein